MTDVDLIDLLCQTELFKGLTPEQMKAVARALTMLEPLANQRARVTAAWPRFALAVALASIGLVGVCNPVCGATEVVNNSMNDFGHLGKGFHGRALHNENP